MYLCNLLKRHKRSTVCIGMCLWNPRWNHLDWIRWNELKIINQHYLFTCDQPQLLFSTLFSVWRIFFIFLISPNKLLVTERSFYENCLWFICFIHSPQLIIYHFTFQCMFYTDITLLFLYLFNIIMAKLTKRSLILMICQK